MISAVIAIDGTVEEYLYGEPSELGVNQKLFSVLLNMWECCLYFQSYFIKPVLWVPIQ